MTTDDTIDGNAGKDIIYLSTQDDLDSTGEAVMVIGASITNVEGITDAGADQSAIVLKLLIQIYFKSKVDGTSLDANPTDLTAGETLTVTNSDNTKLTVHGGAFQDTITSSTGADLLKGNWADPLKLVVVLILLKVVLVPTFFGVKLVLTLLMVVQVMIQSMFLMILTLKHQVVLKLLTVVQVLIL